MFKTTCVAAVIGLLGLAAAAQPKAEDLYNEAYRPQFHFSPRTNWTNDPNGLVFYRGEYHLFFQHNPAGINWGNMTWGHAVSKDLVHWQQLANALEPDSLGTMFSGSAVVDWRNTAGFGKEALVCIYTAAGGTNPQSKGQPFTQCLAYSTDGRTFVKYEKNPVLKHIAGGNRDPKVIWHEPTKAWIMALFLDKNDFAFLSSPDLKNWKHLHNITVPGCGECPDFFPMAVDGEKGKVKWVWTAANGKYLVGDFDGRKFTPDNPTPLPADWGKNYYAVQTYSDVPEADGRRIQIAWMRGGKYPGMPFNQQMSFPCEMKLRSFSEGLRLCRTPVKEIELLHGAVHSIKGRQLEAGARVDMATGSDVHEVRAEFRPTAGATLSFEIRGEKVVYSISDGKLSCLGQSVDVPLEDGRLRLQILVDRSSIEIFANDGKAVMTSCFLPKAEDKTLAFHTTAAAEVVSMQVYEMKSIWRK